MEKIALIEFGGSHDECILSQLCALKKRGCHITFYGTQEIINRNSSWQQYLDKIELVHFPHTAIGDFMTMRKLNRSMKENEISKAILNTAQGGHVRNLCLTSLKATEFIGIIHTLRKFQGSFTQNIINRKIKKYFVLNDYFLGKIERTHNIKVESFYPLRFPQFDHMIEKKKDEIWITIIGGVENRRKDLLGSIELMKQLKDLNVRFIFLGMSHIEKTEFKTFHNEIQENGLLDKVKLFNSFVSEEEFDAYLRNSDFIWPMVHPGTPSAGEYFKNQISGAMNVSFAYHIPLMVHENYLSEWEDLKHGISYTHQNFKTKVNEGIMNSEHLRNQLRAIDKFRPEFQEEKYVKFIFGNR